MTRQTGNIICCKCGVAYGYKPEVKDASHGYCPTCYQLELAEVETWVAQQKLIRAQGKLIAAQAEFEAAKAEFEAQVQKAVTL